ncbi:MbtH family protein [Streptomyces murinus]|uniref:MbtH family protein n=1 Tax=Streptomyces murinus TaxID=33900 RepID=UPI000A39BE4E|nr:MbtH family protein [Streptomyces murinus]
MTNPFDETDRSHVVLRNSFTEYSLWPVGSTVPDGWEVVHGEDSRQACLSYIEEQAA